MATELLGHKHLVRCLDLITSVMELLGISFGLGMP